MSTVTLSTIPEWTAAMGVPRLVGIEYPQGVSFGRPGDVRTQTAVLTDTLRTLEEMTGPRQERHLPFQWAEQHGDPSFHPSPPPPITQAIMRRPWYYRKLLKKEIPND